ncbi:Cytoplasmic tRNA 2-thiolation protein 1 [Melia azedarach]|uniref:Cytoplasmic tRNA 2-thiolation protein 1 n=1 Tax=Melia azedarach TaxID=155640 RepID=A0ACC1Y952_MELAZ|nr:Cytoplasmic tRNA 2-thiolation protein 1 [Melia azedarach]
MESKKSSGSSCCFKMPLHYPRYNKRDYQVMPEWKLDRLLTEYGLSTHGDLAYKREFAMGAFLWPDLQHQYPKSSSV